MQKMPQAAQDMIADKVCPGRRLDHIVKNPVNIKKNEEGGNNNGHDSTKDMPAQNFQVINEGHWIGIGTGWFVAE